MLRHVRLFVTPWTVARQAPLSMGFSRQEYWSGSPRPPPGELPGPGIEPGSLVSPLSSSRFSTAEPPGTQKVQGAVRRSSLDPVGREQTVSAQGAAGQTDAAQRQEGSHGPQQAGGRSGRRLIREGQALWCAGFGLGLQAFCRH